MTPDRLENVMGKADLWLFPPPNPAEMFHVESKLEEGIYQYYSLTS
jgi:hypothetical protein